MPLSLASGAARDSNVVLNQCYFSGCFAALIINNLYVVDVLYWLTLICVASFYWRCYVVGKHGGP